MITNSKHRIGGLITLTKSIVLIFLIWTTLIVVCYKVFDFTFLTIPFLPLSIIGTALTFYLGFKNNATYERLYEARKNYGSIVNDSRSFVAMLNTYISNQFNNSFTPSNIQAIKLEMVNRHIAWLYAHKFYLRNKKQPWEYDEEASDDLRKSFKHSLEAEIALPETLKLFISEAEVTEVMAKANPATALLNNQSKKLKKLRAENVIEDFRMYEIQNAIKDFFDSQGKNERIKNFPYPLQFSQMVNVVLNLFCWLLPLGILGEMSKQGGVFIWLTIPFTVIICWVFFIMEVNSECSENPFSGLVYDIPITNITRSIEIDILQMIDAENIPNPTIPKNGILM